MRRLSAAISAACLFASVFSAGMAHAGPGGFPTGGIKPALQTSTKDKADKAKKEQADAAKKPRKVSGKRNKRNAGADKGDVVVGTLKTYRSTAGYPKAENPLVAGVKTASYSGLIQTYAKTYGVPVDLAHAVVRIESNFNPRARGSAGEIGLMQIKPATARMMGYRGGAKGLYDPETNIKFGMKYLAMAHELGGGTVCGTILKYNAGHGAKRMNPVSKRYCGKVQSYID
ncbi:lytic transglycosylase domain-containing protein [Shinella sp.]|uniref:lytic transglycosylase domain-containing protein n=2 Tax=Shinella sp. TaxID=1870904 RepID=UPI003917F587